MFNCNEHIDDIEENGFKLREEFRIEDGNIGFYVQNKLVTIYKSRDQKYFQNEAERYITLENEMVEEIVPIFCSSKITNDLIHGYSPDIDALNKYLKIRYNYFPTNIFDVIKIINATQITSPGIHDGDYRISFSIYPDDCLISNLDTAKLKEYVDEYSIRLRLKSDILQKLKLNHVIYDSVTNQFIKEGKDSMIVLLNQEIRNYFNRYTNTIQLCNKISGERFFTSNKDSRHSYSYITFPYKFNQSDLVYPIYRFVIDSTENGFTIKKFLLNEDVTFKTILKQDV
jgi:hypothetical protein